MHLLITLLCGTALSAIAQNDCGTISTFADALAPTQQIHVALNGSNGTGNGSEANPYATIGFAANQAKPGTAIVVHAGTYSGGIFLNDLHGSAEAPIWIGGAAGETRPIISGATEGLHFARPQYVIVHDLEVAQSSGNGINADDGGQYDNPLAAHHVIFRNLFIHDIGGGGNQDGLKLSGVNDFLVLDCEIARCGGAGSGSGIDMVGCHHGLIARCNLYDHSGNAVQCKGGSEDVEIRWCRLHEAGQRALNIGGSTGFEFFRPPLSTTKPNFEAKDIRAFGNIISGANASIAFVGCVESVAAHNTIVDPHNWILRVLQETTTSGSFEFLPCGNNSFLNNLVYFDHSDLSTHVNIGPNTAAGTFSFANNLWFAHDNPGQSTPNLPVAEKNGIYGENPQLLNPAAGDYRIQVESPASGAGQSPALISGDYEGRCLVDPPSIGAFEKPAPAGDVNGNGAVNVDDLLWVINSWGDCPARIICKADIAPVGGDGVVNVDDLLVVVNNWNA